MPPPSWREAPAAIRPSRPPRGRSCVGHLYTWHHNPQPLDLALETEPIMTADLDAKHFHDEDAAREFLEEVRWPDGPICPKCGTVGAAYKTHKVGVYRCAA